MILISFHSRDSGVFSNYRHWIMKLISPTFLKQARISMIRGEWFSVIKRKLIFDWVFIYFLSNIDSAGVSVKSCYPIRNANYIKFYLCRTYFPIHFFIYFWRRSYFSNIVHDSERDCASSFYCLITWDFKIWSLKFSRKKLRFCSEVEVGASY